MRQLTDQHEIDYGNNGQQTMGATRYMNTLFKLLYIIAAVSILSVSTAMAASLSIVAAGNGVYNIQGTSMDGVAGIQFDIIYEQMTQPTVASGTLVGGAMLAANTSKSGNIKAAIISTTPFSGSGTVATITFASHSNTAPLPTLSYTMIDSKGGTIIPNVGSIDSGSSLSTTVTTPFIDSKPAPSTAQSTVSTNSSSTTQPSTLTTSSTSTPVVLGSVTMPATESKENTHVKQPKYEPEVLMQPSETEPIIVPSKTPEAVTEKKAEPEKTVEPKQTTYSSVLDRFRNYRGELSPLILTALFSKPVAENVVQEPAIVVTNGTDKAVVTFMLSDEKSAPNFALTESKMISLSSKRDEVSKWILEALPQKNTLKTTITMISGNEIVEYPLVVVPSANGITDKETDFALFLKDTGAKTPRRDLNGDGIHDFQDNYIYTAHYLILQKSNEKPKQLKPAVK